VVVPNTKFVPVARTKPFAAVTAVKPSRRVAEPIVASEKKKPVVARVRS
jgi:hypothetical protein